MEKQTGSCIARSEDGQEFVIEKWTEFRDAGDRGDPGAVLKGLGRCQTQDGMAVNRIEKGRYEIVVLGLTVTSDDPDAP